jgi:uncharacterized membrane protein
MKSIQKSIQIHAPASQVFEYLTTPQNLPEIWPSMIEVSNAKRAADGSHSFDFTYKMGGVHFKGHSQSTKSVQNKSYVVESSGGIKSTFTWSFDGQDGFSTVNLRCDYEIPIPLVGKIAETFLVKLNEREADHMLANLKERLETQEAIGTSAQKGKEKRV